MTSYELRQLQKRLYLEKIKALDLANKKLLEAKQDYERILKYYQSLGV